MVGAIGGIMVEGISVGGDGSFLCADPNNCGEDECVKAESLVQDFRDADMIAINMYEAKNTKVSKNDKPVMWYPVYGIYGNKVVSANATEIEIAQHLMQFRNKIVLAKQKPYILSGDFYHKVFI